MNKKLEKIIHSKSFLIAMIVLLIILVISAGTYAWFTWSSTNNTNLTMSIGASSDVIFKNGNDISTNKLAPVFNYTDGEKTSFTIINKSTTSFSYRISLNITSIDNELKNKSLKYKLVSNNTIITEGNFSNIENTNKLYEGGLFKGNVGFIFYLYIDGNEENNLNMINKSLVGTITVEERKPALDTLNKLNSLNNTITLANDTPDFTTVSGNNGEDSNGNTGLGDGTKGIYKAEDDFGTSYYFRGAVDNNYVKFANFYWRIIRINGDGSIRMIYAGTKAYANGDTNQDSYIGYSEYNTNYEDNGYVGYMYGNFTTPTNCNTDNSTGVTTCTGGSTSYEEAHANINDSNIKAYIDNWYNNNLKDYAYAIEDTIYCNDRSITPVDSFLDMALTGTGKGIENTAYSGLTEGYINHTSSLKCVNKNDRFTVNNSIGNAKLTNPIALITSDEVIMGGLGNYDYANGAYIANPDSYLTTPNYWYWTMTPFAAAGGGADVFNVNGDGRLDGRVVYSNCGVRPVVSLSSDAISGGKGTMNDPFTVG